MIELTKMNNEKFFINPNLIEIIEDTPDTLITTTSGRKYYVLETVLEVCKKSIDYFQLVNTQKLRKSNIKKCSQE